MILVDIACWLVFALAAVSCVTGALVGWVPEGPASVAVSASFAVLAFGAAALSSRRSARLRLDRAAAAAGLMAASLRLSGGMEGYLFPAAFLFLLWMALPPVSGPVMEAGLAIGVVEAASELLSGPGGMGSVGERVMPALRALLAIPIFAAVCDFLLERPAGRAGGAAAQGAGLCREERNSMLHLVTGFSTSGSVAAAVHAAISWLTESEKGLTATVALLDDDPASLRVYESMGPLSAGRSGRAFPHGESVAGWVLRSGGSVRRNGLRLGDRQVCPLSPADEAGRKTGSCAAAPVTCSGRMAGVVLVESTQDDGFPAGAEASISIAAGLLGQALERLLLEEQRQARSSRDGLTGLPTLSDAMELLRHATRDVQRFGKSVSALVVGIDGLAAFNRSSGFRSGDAILRASASRIMELSGDETLVARIGGARFAVVLPGAERARAEALAECIARSFADKPLPVDGRETPVSVCVGAATTHSDRRVVQLLEEAGRALESARQSSPGSYRAVELTAIPQPAQ